VIYNSKEELTSYRSPELVVNQVEATELDP